MQTLCLLTIKSRPIKLWEIKGLDWEGIKLLKCNNRDRQSKKRISSEIRALINATLLLPLGTKEMIMRSGQNLWRTSGCLGSAGSIHVKPNPFEHDRLRKLAWKCSLWCGTVREIRTQTGLWRLLRLNSKKRCRHVFLYLLGCLLLRWTFILRFCGMLPRKWQRYIETMNRKIFKFIST